MNAMLPIAEAQPTSAPNFPFFFTHSFDEITLFPGTNALASGAAEILYDEAGDWAVGILVLTAFRYGKAPVVLPSEHPLYRAVRDAVQLLESDHIDVTIADKLIEDGLMPANPNAEHTLGVRQLGVRAYG